MSEWTGLLRLKMEDRIGKTVPGNVYFEGAFKVMRPIYHDDSGQACYYLLNPGGGYLDGDRYSMHISLEEHARLTLTTQSSTKVYKTPRSFAYQENHITLKSGSYLEYFPDPLIVYRDGCFKQKTVIHMDREATLIYTDIITPGWSPDGEQFSYKMIQQMTEIFVNGELMVYDHLKLSPTAQRFSAMGGMDGFTHLGSMIVVSPNMQNHLIESIYKQLSSSKTVRIGISALPIPGFSLRILANNSQIIERILTEIHQIISESWYEKKPSFLRKY